MDEPTAQKTWMSLTPAMVAALGALRPGPQALNRNVARGLERRRLALIVPPGIMATLTEDGEELLRWRDEQPARASRQLGGPIAEWRPSVRTHPVRRRRRRVSFDAAEVETIEGALAGKVVPPAVLWPLREKLVDLIRITE